MAKKKTACCCNMQFGCNDNCARNRRFIVSKTPYESYRAGTLPKGCQLCVKGQKLVLFVTGICSRKCFFCPISDQKKDKDVIYANEMPVRNFTEILTEAKLCSANGAGITGGDPLLRLSRTVDYIRRLKKHFGSGFHIHLYTPLENVSLDVLEKLYLAGLDEIRFHPDIEDDCLWERIVLARNFDWRIGIEIPVIPGKKKRILRLIKYVKGLVDFVNLNELELSDTNASNLCELGFKAKDEISYGVLGSEALALDILGECAKIGINTHYCTAVLKDKYQLARRIKRRAVNAAKKYDKVTAEGILVRGAVYLNEMLPCAGYRQKLAEADSVSLIKRLNLLRRRLVRDFLIPADMIEVDPRKIRLLTSVGFARKLSKSHDCGYKCAVVEEYPTWDGFEVSVSFL